MSTRRGALLAGAPEPAFGASRFLSTKTLPSRTSTIQAPTGSMAGAPSASPVRRQKRAWCHGHRTDCPTSSPFAERSLVVAALGADGQQLAIDAGHQHFFLAHVANEHGAVGDVAGRDA